MFLNQNENTEVKVLGLCVCVVTGKIAYPNTTGFPFLVVAIYDVLTPIKIIE